MPERPACACHDEPMWRNGGYWRCSVGERARNKIRMRPGGLFIGREHQFPAPREAVFALTRRLREESGLWPA